MRIRIYSVGVWNKSLENSSQGFANIRIYSVGVWNLTAWALVLVCLILEFTPLEFETIPLATHYALLLIRIYSVGVWNRLCCCHFLLETTLEFNPLEFETYSTEKKAYKAIKLEFTPLEFETHFWICDFKRWAWIRIYSIGVWNAALSSSAVHVSH